MPTSTLLQEQHEAIKVKYDELKPLVEQFHEVERILRSYEALDSPSNGVTAPEQTSEAPRRRRGRRVGGPDRAKQFLTAVEHKPGATVTEIAAEIGDVVPNYLYRVRERLMEQGKIVEQGDGYKLAPSS